MPRSNSGQVRAEVLELVQTEGIRAAAEAAIAVCRDPKAPAAAKAAMATLLMRTSSLGGFGKEDPAEGKELHEMMPEELDRAIAELERLVAERTRPVIMDYESDEVDEEGENVFA